MGKVRGDAQRGRPVRFGWVDKVDPRLRYLLKRDYLYKGNLVTLLQVPEVRDSLLSATLSGENVDAKVLYDAIKPVYNICIADGKAARAKGYPTACVRSCHNKLDALINPNPAVYAGPIVKVGKVGSDGRLKVSDVKVIEHRNK